MGEGKQNFDTDATWKKVKKKISLTEKNVTNLFAKYIASL